FPPLLGPVRSRRETHSCRSRRSLTAHRPPMPVLQLDDQTFPLSAGTTRIGAGAGADIIVPGYSAIGVEAVIDGGSTPTIRRAEEAAHVKVNGVLLGAEPTPLMHGDKIEVAGLELRFADDAK